jgi:hypothetical protein
MIGAPPHETGSLYAPGSAYAYPMPTIPPDSHVILIYPFRFVDPRTGRWVRARYRSTREQIERCYTQWGITGEPERIIVGSGSFSPHR